MVEITRILASMASGDSRATDELLRLVYDELRRLAAHKLAQEPSGQTLQPTALVHEAWLRLSDGVPASGWESRRHFFAAAAESMRRILVDNARRKQSQKRGGDFRRVEMQESLFAGKESKHDLLLIDEALEQLAGVDPQKAELVKLRFFAGLSEQEAADAMGISRATAARHWAYSRAWLYERLGTT